MTDKQELVQKYQKKLQEQLYGEAVTPTSGYSYSQAYKIFKREQVGVGHLLFEKLCISSEKILQVNIAQKDADKIALPIKLAHLAVTPESVYSLTYLSALLSAFLSAAVFAVLMLFGMSGYAVIIAGIGSAVVLLFYVPTVPKSILTGWRARTSDQLVLAVLYLVIYMEHTPNIERAVRFVAEHVAPPLSLDFMKVLWDVETKNYSSIIEALSDYAKTWQGWDDDFIESVELVESSLYEADDRRRQDILDKSVSVILDGTQDHMLTFAHNLQSPMESLHMLGVVLPVMGLVMLPMIGAFMGASIKWWHIAVMYNIFLPIIVYLIGRSVLTTRPAGSDTTDVYKFIQQKYLRPALKIGRMELPISPAGLGVIVFALIGWPGVFYLTNISIRLSGDALRKAIFSNAALFSSIDIIAAAGLAMGMYYWWSVHHLVKVKKSIEAMENEFSASAFALGQRLEERTPVELVFTKMAQSEKGDIAKFYQIVDYNLRQLGTSLGDAITNEKYGALASFPSTAIKSAMAVLIESAKKSPEIVGRSMLTISTYSQAVHKVTERMKDLLADTTSSMSSQVKIFIPVISGIVIGLASLTTNILMNLGEQLTAISATGSPEEAIASGAGLMDIFQINSMIPSPVFQLIVGVYVLQIVWILSYMLSGVIYGHDEIERKWLLAQNFLLATVFYIIITSVTVLLFSALAAPISNMTFGAE
ncbi:MAG: hypothetical protein V1839_00345 [archaeon]